jgi:tyrosine phenol-lyase
MQTIIEAVEVGSVMFGRTDPDTGETHSPPMELVRLAIPRRAYTQSHIDYVIEATTEVYQRRHDIRGLRLTEAPPVLRHFTARFEEV